MKCEITSQIKHDSFGTVTFRVVTKKHVVEYTYLLDLFHYNRVLEIYEHRPFAALNHAKQYKKSVKKKEL